MYLRGNRRWVPRVMKKIANNVHHEALIMANFVVIFPGIAFKLEKLIHLFQVSMHVRS